jgi:hypothetical protein
MRFLAILFVVCLTTVACSPEADVTGSTNVCATNLYHQYNSKDLAQCIDVCSKCDHGTRASCSTSCTLKGAR